jgi:hypothetical protein
VGLCTRVGPPIFLFNTSIKIGEIILPMTCDNRTTSSTPLNIFTFPVTGRARLFSSPDKQDLETIYEVN